MSNIIFTNRCRSLLLLHYYFLQIINIFAFIFIPQFIYWHLSALSKSLTSLYHYFNYNNYYFAKTVWCKITIKSVFYCITKFIIKNVFSFIKFGLIHVCILLCELNTQPSLLHRCFISPNFHYLNYIICLNICHLYFWFYQNCHQSLLLFNRLTLS